MQDPTGRLFRLHADGQIDLLLANGPSPNGLVLNAAENVLFVAMTRANSIWRVPMLPDNAGIYKVGAMIQLSGGTGGPDGMAIDEAGNLYVCHAGLGSVWVFDPHGEPLLRIRSPIGRSTTNLAFGGPDRHTLYITESSSGSVLTAPALAPGRPMFGLSAEG